MARCSALRTIAARVAVFSILAGAGTACLAQDQAPGAPSPSRTVEIPGVGTFRLSSACEHANLAVYPLHGKPGAGAGPAPVPLARALEDGLAVVHETGEVNLLQVENKSDRSVLIQAGDIVEGGNQDRVMAYDFLLEPRSGKVPIGAFCVEEGRWARRGQERADRFSSSRNKVGGKELKRALRQAKSQQVVWSEVEAIQTALTGNLASDVRSPVSLTSMGLTLENKKVRKATTKYREALSACIEGRQDVLGVVVAVDGKLSSANLLAWPELFRAEWPKMLSAFAVEALATFDRDATPAAPGLDEVSRWLAAPSEGRPDTVGIRPGLVEKMHTRKESLAFVTLHDDLGWLRAELLSSTD